MSNFDSKLSEVSEAIRVLSSMTTSGTQVVFDEYRKARIRMNIPALEIIFGASIDGNKVKYDQPVPSMHELNKLFDIINQFYEQIEKPIMMQFKASAEDVNSSVMLPPIEESIPKVKKVNAKNVSAAITGGGGSVPFPMISMMFKPSQIIEMSAMSMDLRKVMMRNKALIVGGAVLGAAAATVTGICVYDHTKKKNNNNNVDQNNDDTPLVDMDDTPLVDMDDTPLVDMGII